MKNSISAIAFATVLVFTGANCFAGSGNDAAAVDLAATNAPAAMVKAPADTAVSKTATPSSKDTSFDPQINVRMGNQYLLLSV